MTIPITISILGAKTTTFMVSINDEQSIADFQKKKNDFINSEIEKYKSLINNKKK